MSTSTKGQLIDVENPATGEVLGSVAAATPQQVADAIAAAQEGRRAMATLPAHGRAELLQRAADGIAARHEELARLLASENGKPYKRGDIWGSVGAWYSGRWWTDLARGYIGRVQDALRRKTWRTREFING